jgi:hypothetical protein
MTSLKHSEQLEQFNIPSKENSETAFMQLTAPSMSCVRDLPQRPLTIRMLGSGSKNNALKQEERDLTKLSELEINALSSQLKSIIRQALNEEKFVRHTVISYSDVCIARLMNVLYGVKSPRNQALTAQMRFDYRNKINDGLKYVLKDEYNKESLPQFLIH